MRVLSFPAGRSSNPYVRIVNDGLSRLGVEVVPYRVGHPLQRADVLHVHWFESILYTRVLHRSPLATEALLVNLWQTAARIRRAGGILAWTAHNAAPHEAPPARHRAAFRRWHARLLSMVDVVVSLSERAIPTIRASYPQLSARYAYVPHPHYRDVYPRVPRDASLYARLGVPTGKFTLGAFGVVRRYKGLAELITMFREVAREDEQLVVAGACYDTEVLGEITACAAGASNVVVVPRELSDLELASYYAATDVALINHRNLQNSGTALAALSFERPLIAPQLGVMGELGAAVGERWCTLFEPPLTAASLRGSLDAIRARKREPTPDLAAFAPARVAELHRAAFSSTLEAVAAARASARSFANS
jgi:beta-1,4-mannosyltransferase